MSLPIFQSEIDAGLEHALSAKACVSYAALVEKCPNFTSASQKGRPFWSPEMEKTIAGLTDKDLYYAQSILVSSSWNLNDDVFLKQEVWNARNTPVHKPTNLGHDEHIIVGHITANWPMTIEGDLIGDDTPIENLPDKFHILTGSVIYMTYTDEELKARAAQLIKEIEEGDMYVSMECWFKGFDYALSKQGTDDYYILPRNENTSFLTRFLRAYGGSGMHEGYKIGRLLRDITFSGKGYVKKPGNPDSVIFTKNNLLAPLKEKKEQFSESGVFSLQANIKENIMTLEDIATKIDAVTASVAKSNELAARVSDLEKTIEAQKAELAQAAQAGQSLTEEKDKTIAQLTSDLEAKAAELATVKAEVASLNETVAAYKDKEAEMKKKEEEADKKAKSAVRATKLIELGVESDKAAEAVAKFEHLDDEAFEAISALFPKKDKEDKKAKSDEQDPSDALDNAEADEDAGVTGGEAESDSEEAKATRAALVEAISAKLGKKSKK